FGVLMIGAGTYPYHCTYHVGLGMRGAIALRDGATPRSGSVGTVFTITVATMNGVDWVYDVQKKTPTGSFEDWKMGVSSAAVTFDSSHQAAGSYQFRSRVHLLSGGQSLYSPQVSVQVTPLA